MKFDTIEVIKTEENYHYIDWTVILDDTESIDDFLFEILWSLDPVSDFVVAMNKDDVPYRVDGAIDPLNVTHENNQYNKNRTRWYKVKAIRIFDDSEIVSKAVMIAEGFDGVHDVMRYNESVLYDMYQGEPFQVVKRKPSGGRCPDCWSESRQQRTRSHCETCHDTGFVTGFFAPINGVQISVEVDARISNTAKTSEIIRDQLRARMSNYPIVRPKDMIVNKDDAQRYQVIHVDITKLPMLSTPNRNSKQNYIISQILTLRELDPDGVKFDEDLTDF